MSMQHSAPISGVSAAGGYIATTGYDNRVILWDSVSGRALTRAWHDHLANQCEFSPDGTLLVTASSDHSARLWTIPEMQLRQVFNAHSDDVMKAAFSPDGRFVATCSYDSTLIVYSLSGDVVCRCVGHKGLIEAFDWSADGDSLVSCGTDGSIKTWSSKDGALLKDESGFEYDMDALVVAPEGHYFIGIDDGSILILSARGRHFVPAHDSGVKKLVMRGNLLLSLGYDQQCILWSVSDLSLTEVARSKFPPHIWARSASFIDESRIVFATFGSRYAIWDSEQDSWDSGDFVPSISLNSVYVSQEGERYAIGDAGVAFKNGQRMGGTGSLCNCIAEIEGIVLAAGQLGVVFNATSGEPLYRYKSPINCVKSVSGSEGTLAVFGTYKGTLLVFQVAGRTLEFVIEIDLGCNAVKGIAAARGLIFCGSADGTLSIIDANSLEIMQSVADAHDGILNGVASYQKGFASISRDLTLRLWSDSGDCLGVHRSRHRKSIKCIAGSRDGAYLASGSYGGTIDVFSTRDDTWVKDLRRPTMSGISSIVWDEAKRVFVASSYDGSLYDIDL